MSDRTRSPRALRREAVWVTFVALLLVSVVSTDTWAGSGSVGIQATGGKPFDRVDDHYKFGFGFNMFGTVRLNEYLDARGNFGVRWNQGKDYLITNESPAPDLGARPGETTGDIQFMPFTVDLIYRLEKWSKNRFWIPYVGAGFGFYDIEAKYGDSMYVKDSGSGFAAGGDEDGDEDSEYDEDGVRKANVFKTGWNAKAGVNFHRTSGLFVNLEGVIHGIQTSRRWTPMYDISFGVGIILPR